MSNLLSVKQAAPLLGVKCVTLYRLCKQREIPYRRIGNAIKFSDADIAQYLNSTFIEPVTAGGKNATAANL